jgi:NADPH:quinone reductase-like Zn-dependent oxidoreductase
MRALRYHAYGPPEVLGIEETPEPSPAAHQVKVRVQAVALNPLDWKIRAGHLRYLPLFRQPPRGMGTDFAGEVVGIGDGPTMRRIGERVFGSLSAFGREGALADYIVVPDDRVLPIPHELDIAQAACLPVAGGTALQALTDESHVLQGQWVLITGAAGGVGHFAVQIAKSFRAYVVAVCSAGNAEFVRTLGADEVVDYAREDFTRRADRFDVIFDAACASTFAASRRLLEETGVYINTSGNAAALVDTVAFALFARFTSHQRAVPFALRNDSTMWRRLLEFVRERGLRAHVERSIALEDVAAAQRSMETGHGRGKIVVRLG